MSKRTAKVPPMTTHVFIPPFPVTSSFPMLQVGQVIRRDGGELWQVVMVNDCRARIQPLAKVHVTMPDGREFDASARGLDIAPNALVSIVTDVARAQKEAELAKLEKFIAVVKAKRVDEELAAKVIEAKAKVTAAAPQTTRGECWTLVQASAFAPAGTPKGHVLAHLRAHPGATTRDIIAAAGSDSGIRAALWRLNKDGVISK